MPRGVIIGRRGRVHFQRTGGDVFFNMIRKGLQEGLVGWVAEVFEFQGIKRRGWVGGPVFGVIGDGGRSRTGAIR